MEKTEIIKKLNEILIINDDSEGLQIINNLIDQLKVDIEKETYIKKPSDKTKLKAIEKMLKYNEKIGRDFIACVGINKKDDKIYQVITDSYQAYVLNDNDLLPFTYGFNNTITADEINKLTENKEIKINSANYPNILNIFNNAENKEAIDIVKITKKEIQLFKKITLPENKKYIYTIPSKENVLMDADYLLTAFDILKTTELNLKITGYRNPVIFENENGKGLLLPMI